MRSEAAPIEADEMGARPFHGSRAADGRNNEDNDFSLLEIEQERVLAFFDENIRGQDAEKATKLFNFLFKDMTNPDLKDILVHKIMKYKANNLQFLKRLVYICVKTTDVK